MFKFLKTNRRWLAALVLVLFSLAGCNGNVRHTGKVATVTPGHYDMVLKAYESGQFLLDGGALTAQDLGGHFQYLKEQGKLPQTVLLEDGEDTSVHSEHLQSFAGLQLEYGFKGFVKEGDQVTVLNAVATDKPDTKE